MLEGTWSSRIDFKNDIGLRNTICQDTPSHKIFKDEFEKIRNTGVNRNDNRNRKNEKRKYYRESITKNGISVKDVFTRESRRKQAPNIQPKKTQFVPKPEEIPPIKPVQSTKILAKRRLHVQSGSFTSLLTCASEKKPSQVFIPQLLRHSLSDDMFTNGAGQCTLGVFENHKLDRKYASSKRAAGHSIFRRLPFRPSGQKSASGTGQFSSRPLFDFRMEDKLEEINTHANKGDRIPRDNFQYENKCKIPSRGQNIKSQKDPQKTSEISTMELDTRNIFTRKVTICDRSCSIGSTVLQTTPESESRFRRELAKEIFSPTSTCNKRMLLVDGTSNGLELDHSGRGQHVCDNRCFRLGMGHTNRTNSSGRRLELCSETLAYKPKGTLCSVHSPEKVHILSQKQSNYDSSRQSHSNCILAQSRRDEVTETISVDEENLALCETDQYCTNSLLHTREVQHDSRPPVTRVIGDRLASKRVLDGKSIQSMGNSTNRLVRDVKVQSSPLVCINRCDGYASTLYKCIQQDMGLRFGLGVSTTTIDSQSYPTSELRARNISSGRTQMDESLLANSVESQGICATNNNKESVRPSTRSGYESSTSGGLINDFGGLEGTGWNKFIKDLPPEDIELLQSAWRPSTWKTYASAWKDWIKWCKSKCIVPNNPTAFQVASYLSYLFRVKKVAYSTILVRKSVIAIFANPEGGHNISSHPVVKSILKAINLKSAERVSSRTQVWNIEDLINWLKLNPPEEGSIYQVSRHCALLLLLASGRRIHDLTLLRTDDEHCCINEEGITLWPVFGSKTDCAKQRQSGWFVKKHQDCQLDMVKWIKQLIEVSSDRRRTSSGLKSLFITTRGKVKPASRTVIAGWLKPVFIELGLEVTPGSIRSAVASYNFENNLPLDDLLKRGNWRGASNFFKHYYKPVSAPSLHTNVMLNSFVPV